MRPVSSSSAIVAALLSLAAAGCAAVEPEIELPTPSTVATSTDAAPSSEQPPAE